MNQTSKKALGFIVGDSLGKTLKWLRILGFNTVAERDLQSGRATLDPNAYTMVRLTRSRSVCAAAGHVVLRIKSDHVNEQLCEIIHLCGIQQRHLRPFSRCIQCNVLIEDTVKVEIRGRVPDYVWQSHETFKVCPQCHRIFWQGTHTEKINKTIQRIFKMP